MQSGGVVLLDHEPVAILDRRGVVARRLRRRLEVAHRLVLLELARLGHQDSSSADRAQVSYQGSPSNEIDSPASTKNHRMSRYA